jgi:hypothetical protein
VKKYQHELSSHPLDTAILTTKSSELHDISIERKEFVARNERENVKKLQMNTLIASLRG